MEGVRAWQNLKPCGSCSCDCDHCYATNTSDPLWFTWLLFPGGELKQIELAGAERTEPSERAGSSQVMHNPTRADSTWEISLLYGSTSLINKAPGWSLNEKKKHGLLGRHLQYVQLKQLHKTYRYSLFISTYRGRREREKLEEERQRKERRNRMREKERRNEALIRFVTLTR